MPLSDNLVDVVEVIGAAIKGDRIAMGDLTTLATTDKSSLVAAINEIKNSSGGGGGATIDDGTTGTGTTWSSAKIDTEITEAIAALVDGAPGTLDTLNKIAIELAANDGAIDSLITQIATKVDQSDIGDVEVDLVSAFNSALA